MKPATTTDQCSECTNVVGHRGWCPSLVANSWWRKARWRNCGPFWLFRDFGCWHQTCIGDWYECTGKEACL